MDLKIVNETLDIRETIFEGNPEQGFECDILLPDYCPDVRRILKCHVTPKVSQCYQNDDKVNIDGFIYIKIYYLCDENKIHSYDAKIPYSKILELKEGVDGISVSVGATTAYVNCRAVNQRRFDVRGAINLSTRITGTTKETVVTEAVGDGIQLKKKSMSGSTLCCEASVQFSVQEEQTVSGNPVNAVIRSEAHAHWTEAKLIPNKAILKGELKTTVVYTDAEGINPTTAVYAFPISRIIDISGATSESQLEIKTDVICVEVLPKQDENGEFTKLGFDVKVNVFIKCFETKNITVSTDAYSTEFDCHFDAKKIPFEYTDAVIDKTFTYRAQTELSNVAIDRIIDLWSSPKNPVTRVDGGKISVDIPIDVFAFYMREDGSADFAEKTVNALFEHIVDTDCDDLLFEPDVKILSCEYNLLPQNKVEVQFEIKLVGSVVKKCADKCICDISVDSSSPKAKDEFSALTIYYCEKGESVWDIAKRYNTSAECIATENELNCEVIDENRIILIPSAN